MNRNIHLLLQYITPNTIPAVSYTAPDLPGNDDEDDPPAALEMLPSQGELDDEDAEKPAPLPPAPGPGPSPVGIGARLPTRNCQPLCEWWKLSPTQLGSDPNDSDEEEANIAQCMAAISTHSRSFADAQHRSNALEWKKAALAELKVHKTNGTWILVPQSKNRPVIGSRWVFTHMYHANSLFNY